MDALLGERRERSLQRKTPKSGYRPSSRQDLDSSRRSGRKRSHRPMGTSRRGRTPGRSSGSRNRPGSVPILYHTISHRDSSAIIVCISYRSTSTHPLALSRLNQILLQLIMYQPIA